MRDASGLGVPKSGGVMPEFSWSLVSRNNSMRTVERLGFCQCSREQQPTVIRVVSGASAETRAARLQSCECDGTALLVCVDGKKVAVSCPDLGFAGCAVRADGIAICN